MKTMIKNDPKSFTLPKVVSHLVRHLYVLCPSHL